MAPVGAASAAPLSDRHTEALGAICRACGLDPTGAVLIRNVNNAVVRLARDPVVVRLVTLPSYVPRAQLAVTAATLFAEHDVPAIRLVPGLAQPVRAEDHVATLWQTVPRAGPAPTGADLARMLRVVHRLPLPVGALPEWDPLCDFRNRLRDAAELDAGDLRFLDRRTDELAAAVEELDFPLPRAVVHGDAHLGNVIPGSRGPVLCDFDSCCIGPPEWDLTPMAVSAVRFGRPWAHQADLAAGYEFDVTSWEGFEILRDIRDLKIVAGVFPGPGRGARVAAEFRRRMASLRSGRLDDRWSLTR
ncbi:MAG: phosphotransferase [Pseudonocardiaceae bacterium]|nr:phosphotransferase [Pseudonocardiaceae bacterium]